MCDEHCDDSKISASLESKVTFEKDHLEILTDVSYRLRTLSEMLGYLGWTEPLEHLTKARASIFQIMKEKRTVLSSLVDGN